MALTRNQADRRTRIRRYTATDAPGLAEMFARSVTQLGPADFTVPQVAAWASRLPSADGIHTLCTDGRTALVAADENDFPVAYGDMETDGHIGFLYCAPEAAGKGTASALYDELERLALARGMDRLYAEASEAARRFFLNKGFAMIARRQLNIDGVAIHNYRVEKPLAGRPIG